MYQVEEKSMETIHLYIVKEEEPRPTVFPIVLSALFLAGIIAAGTLFPYHKPLEQKTIRVPALFLPPVTFTATAPIIPTGVKTYPATFAHGKLTITNGSVISQIIPKGFTVDGVVTDTAVFVPAGSANGYGYATVAAHAVVSGKRGNFPALAINQVEGSSVYIRNLKAFLGGKDIYSIKVVTPQDRQTAVDSARASLTTQVARRHAILAKPCYESSRVKKAVVELFWTCQYITFTVPSYMHVAHAQLFGNKVLVHVEFVARPRRIETK